MEKMDLSQFKQVYLLYNGEDPQEFLVKGTPGEDVLRVQEQIARILAPVGILTHNDGRGNNKPLMRSDGQDAQDLVASVEDLMNSLGAVIMRLDDLVKNNPQAAAIPELWDINRDLQALAK